ncbi:EthD family reductase [Pseudonocardia xishanensis]|uniref:EthD domain-containing protein n=1 Tax=Pseudonocardia xishanensis TaxID=630995 RepID=A0ABP8S2U1_9PSEU
MFKLVGLWSAPAEADVEEFEKHYAEVHVPLAKAVPGLRRITLTRAGEGFAGAEPAFYRLAEMYFDSPEAMAESAGSDEWHAMHADGGHLVERYGLTLQAGAGWEE